MSTCLVQTKALWALDMTLAHRMPSSVYVVRLMSATSPSLPGAHGFREATPSVLRQTSSWTQDKSFGERKSAPATLLFAAYLLASIDHVFVICRYTFNTPANEVNSTQVNLKERQGFILVPFTLPTATAAASYSIERDGYVIEPQYNFHT